MSTWKNFETYNAQNPRLYSRLVALSRALKDRGFKRYGMAGLFEVLRYEEAAKYGVDFKVNNDFRAAYARVIMANEPDLSGFFEIRNSKLDGADDPKTGRLWAVPKPSYETIEGSDPYIRQR